MEAYLSGLFVFMAAQFGLIWYRLGRLEQKLTDTCNRIKNLSGCKEEQNHE